MPSLEFEGELSTLGFIGLGVMGLPMARNLLNAGYPVIVHSRSRQRADDLVSEGARWASSPSDVARAATVVVTMLPDSSDVRDVADGPSGLFAGASPGLTWIDMSSIDPQVTRSLAVRAAQFGIECLDAPVSGGERGAVDATLSIMVGGPQATFDRCLPLLSRLGGAVVRVGDTGAGQLAKVCNQIVVGCTIAAVAEALTLAGQAGVDPAAVRQVMLGGLASSRVLEVHGERMLRRTFAPGFRAVLHRKDLLNALDAARGSGSALFLTALVSELMTAQVAAGGGDLDHAALVKVYESLSGRRPVEAATSLDDPGRIVR